MLFLHIRSFRLSRFLIQRFRVSLNQPAPFQVSRFRIQLLRVTILRVLRSRTRGLQLGVRFGVLLGVGLLIHFPLIRAPSLFRSRYMLRGVIRTTRIVMGIRSILALQTIRIVMVIRSILVIQVTRAIPTPVLQVTRINTRPAQPPRPLRTIRL